ncbi:hypothetical protein ACWCSH_44705 [Streptosporangium sp. NPDC001682]
MDETNRRRAKQIAYNEANARRPFRHDRNRPRPGHDSVTPP